MIENSKALVINTIKYGDSSLIANCYTEKCGMKSYMLKGILNSKKAKVRSAYFQPLMQLNLTANHNNKGPYMLLGEFAGNMRGNIPAH
jgi:DNA repair protein RecO (recombination protein O)